MEKAHTTTTASDDYYYYAYTVGTLNWGEILLSKAARGASLEFMAAFYFIDIETLLLVLPLCANKDKIQWNPYIYTHARTVVRFVSLIIL